MHRHDAITLLLAAALALGVGEVGGRAAEPKRADAPPGSSQRGVIDYLRTIDLTVIERMEKPRSFWGKLLEWVAGPAELSRMLRPYGMAEDSSGRLIVADPGLGTVHIFDFERRRHQVLRGRKRERFHSPIGVAIDADDNIYVTDSERAAIYVFNRKGKFLRALGRGRQSGVLQRPTGLALDPVRRVIYLTDTRRHQVLVLNLKGELLRVIGGRGSGPGQFNYPTALTLANEKLYVVDAMNFRIQMLTREGEFLRSFGQLGNRSGTLNRPKGIAVDSDGNLYVVDALFETVQIFDTEGRLLYFFGSTGDGPEEFQLPSAIHIAPRDRIYVADSLNRRVQVFRYRRMRP